MIAIVLPDAVAQRPVGRRRSEFLDPGMLVRGNRLVGQLTADPMCFLGQYDSAAQPRRGKRSSASAEPTSDDGNVRAEDLHASTPNGHWPADNLIQTVGFQRGRIRQQTAPRECRTGVRRYSEASFADEVDHGIDLAECLGKLPFPRLAQA